MLVKQHGNPNRRPRRKNGILNDVVHLIFNLDFPTFRSRRDVLADRCHDEAALRILPSPIATFDEAPRSLCLLVFGPDPAGLRDRISLRDRHIMPDTCWDW